MINAPARNTAAGNATRPSPARESPDLHAVSRCTAQDGPVTKSLHLTTLVEICPAALPGTGA